MSLLSSEIDEFKGYTGTLLEDEIFPACAWDARWEQTGYLPRREALYLARASQPEDWDPTDPFPPRANELHYQVCRALGERDYSRLLMYTAARTALDRFHGVDGWFEYGGRSVTVDVTLNPAKADGYKADVVVLLRGEAGELESYARQIADELQTSRQLPFALVGSDRAVGISLYHH